MTELALGALRAPTGLFLRGRWCDASDGAVVAVEDPATEEVVAYVPNATDEDVDAAIASAAEGFRLWRAVGAWDRSATLRRAADLIRDEADRFAAVMTAELSKPLAQSRSEVLAAAEQFDWYADEARRVYGRIVPGHHPDVRIFVLREPVGPVAAFSPWNFPALLPARKIAPALAAGCSIVVMPAIEAPLSGLLLAEALQRAGLPDGVLSVLTGDPARIAARLVDSPVVRKISLTGSVRVGIELTERAARNLTQVSMELGGHAPVLVFPDADILAAARACALGKFRNAGQVCIAASRFLVHESVAEVFTSEFVDQTRRLRVGPGSDPTADMGPLGSARRLAAVEGLVADAVAKGAVVTYGGARPDDFALGYFFAPTVLTEVTEEMAVMTEEPFGPIAPIATFSTFDEAIARANATSYGLAGFVYTRDLALAHRAAEALEVGMVGVNHLTIATAEAPFGGVKRSGFGREGGTEGIEAYTHAKYVNVMLPEKPL